MPDARPPAIDLAHDWRLGRTHATSGGKVAYDVLGDGPPVVLVHGTPSWSYLWRTVAPELAERFTVHVYDLLGYGTSEQREGQDVSVDAQTRILGELLDLWELDAPCVVGHDIGGVIVLRQLLFEGRSFRRLALCDAVVVNPWITPFTRHLKRHLEAFATVPEHIHRELVAAHMRTAIARDTTDAELEPYLRPWLGPEGQAAYYRKAAQLDERYTGEVEPRLGDVRIPTLVLWGKQDEWLSPGVARRIADAIPDARLSLVPGGGHFLPEDQPARVAAELAEFFAPQ